MSTTMTTTAARIPSSFGMPTAGHTFGALATCVVRESRLAVQGIAQGSDIATGVFAGAVTGDVKGYVPGTSVWRPPSC